MQLKMINGAPNRRGKPSVKTPVLHNNNPKHWYIPYNKSNNITLRITEESIATNR